ncbi:hypothetical protein FRC07_006354, partial [Ceratobasidium sp. 392]
MMGNIEGSDDEGGGNEGNDLDVNITQGHDLEPDAGMGLDDADEDLEANLYIGKAPAQGLRRNPPVPKPPSESDSDKDEDESNRPNRNPNNVEHKAPPNLDALDEPQLTDTEMRRILNLRLGDLAQDEWLYM